MTAAVVVIGLGGVLAACGSSKPSTTSSTTKTSSASGPTSGGTLKVLETTSYAGAWPVGLDPATDTSDLADAQYMDAIYGDLFEQGTNGKIIDDLATGYSFSNGGKTVTITLRQGVKFSDGTPFNAAAVKFNISRDLEPKYACICDSTFPVSSITTPNNYTVVLHLSRVFYPIIDAFPQAAPDWIVSPTALKSMGEKAFQLKPVGAGPFTVVSDSLSSKLVLKKNPNYWQKGHPYLDQLIFNTVGTDQSAYDAIITGEDDMEQFFGTYSLLPQAKKTLDVQSAAGGGPLDVQLNEEIAPFNNITNRKILFYATNPAPIAKSLTDGTGIVTQSPGVPGDLVGETTVPGYPSYNPTKAKALLKQQGGLSFTFDAAALGAGLQVAEALEAQWKSVGINVKLNPLNDLQAILNAFKGNSYQAIAQGIGGLNPAIGAGSLLWRVYSKGPFTSVHDPQLDALINAATSTPSVSQQKADYEKVYARMAQQADILELYAAKLYTISKKTVQGPGISDGNPVIFWEDAYVS